MFGGGKRNMTAAMALVGGICLLGQIAGGQSRPAGLPGPAEIVSIVSVDLAAAQAGPLPAKACLGGSRLLAAITAAPGGEAAWELRSGKVVLGRGQARLDALGRGQASVTLPDVLARAEAALSVVSAGRQASRRVDILPAAMLRDVRATLAALELGVMDARGLVQAAMKSQEVAFTDLRPQLENDYFHGGIVILAGFDDANMLADTCNRMAGRVRQGMALVVLNPPAGWQALGVRRTELPPQAATAEVHLAKNLCSTVRQSDLAQVELSCALEADPNAETLVWFETRGRAREGGSAAKHPLAVAQPLEKGVVLAVTMPQLTDCYSDPVGRCMLSEIMMWILKRSQRPKERR
jgi:hypothetical protein